MKNIKTLAKLVLGGFLSIAIVAIATAQFSTSSTRAAGILGPAKYVGGVGTLPFAISNTISTNLFIRWDMTAAKSFSFQFVNETAAKETNVTTFTFGVTDDPTLATGATNLSQIFVWNTTNANTATLAYTNTSTSNLFLHATFQTNFCEANGLGGAYSYMYLLSVSNSNLSTNTTPLGTFTNWYLMGVPKS